MSFLQTYYPPAARFLKACMLLTLLFSQNNKAAALVTTDGCGETKGCFQDPIHCETSECDVLVTWQRNGSFTNFGILGNVESSEDYVSFAFSYDDHMGTDDVWGCLRLSGGEIVLDHSENIGEENNQLETTGSDNFEARYVNGKIECTFTRQNKMEGEESTFFDLDAQPYYLLEARGPRSGIKLGEHDRAPLASTDPIDFTLTTITGGTAEANIVVKMHGILMVVGWLGCASIALILARYYKPMWPDKIHFGQKVWFTWHRSLMVANVLCSCIAFIMIFISVEGWVSYDSTSDTAFVHAVIGCIVVALGIINPILAIFRPPPTSQNRPLFNWSHWFLGTSSYLLAVVNIFLGVDVYDMPSYSLWILAGWLCFHFIFEIFMEVLNCMQERSDAFTSYRVYKMMMKSSSDDLHHEMNGELRTSQVMDINDDNGKNATTQPPAMAPLRFYALCTYMVVTLGIMFYLIIAVILQ